MGYFNSIYAADLPHRAVAVYMYLKDRTNKDGTCWPSIRTVALDDLCKAGFLAKEDRWRENGGRTSNLYRIT